MVDQFQFPLEESSTVLRVLIHVAVGNDQVICACSNAVECVTDGLSSNTLSNHGLRYS